MEKGSKTMKAVVTTGNGGYDKLEYRDVPVPRNAWMRDSGLPAILSNPRGISGLPLSTSQ